MLGSHDIRQPDENVFRLSPCSASETLSSKFFELEIVQGEHPQGLIRETKIGGMVLLRSLIEAGRVTAARSDRLIRHSNSNAFLLGLAVKGQTTIYQEAREAQLSPGDMILIDSHRKYELELDHETEMIWLKFSTSAVQSRIIEHWRYLGLPLKTEFGIGHVVANMLDACINTAPYISAADSRRFESSFIELVGAAFRSQIDEANDSETRHGFLVLNRIRDYIEDHLDNPNLNPKLIAGEIGLSERYIRKLFASRDMTLMGWIRDRRLQKCHDSICNNDLQFSSLSDIAYAHGFNDISSFNRSFKDKYRMSPSALKLKNDRMAH